jgi:hypothetical protein
MWSGSIQQRDQEKIEGRRGGLRREVRERSVAEHDPILELLGQLLSCPGDRGPEWLDGGHLFRPVRITPRQATVAAADLEDAGPVEVDEVEQCADLVFLRINLDRHLLSSPSIGSRAALRHSSRMVHSPRKTATVHAGPTSYAT